MTVGKLPVKQKKAGQNSCFHRLFKLPKLTH